MEWCFKELITYAMQNMRDLKMVSSETNPKLVRKVTSSTKVYARLDRLDLLALP